MPGLAPGIFIWSMIRKDHAPNKKMEWDDDSEKSHPDPGCVSTGGNRIALEEPGFV